MPPQLPDVGFLNYMTVPMTVGFRLQPGGLQASLGPTVRATDTLVRIHTGPKMRAHEATSPSWIAFCSFISFLSFF